MHVTVTFRSEMGTTHYKHANKRHAQLKVYLGYRARFLFVLKFLLPMHVTGAQYVSPLPKVRVPD